MVEWDPKVISSVALIRGQWQEWLRHGWRRGGIPAPQGPAVGYKTLQVDDGPHVFG